MQHYIDKIKKLIENFDDATLKALTEISYTKTFSKATTCLKQTVFAIKVFGLKMEFYENIMLTTTKK